MNKTEALELQEKLLRLCRTCNAWVMKTEELKPDLRMIKLEISLKIGKDE